MEIAKELNTTPVLDKIQDYKRKWTENVNRIQSCRLYTLIKYYAPKGERNKGRQLKTLQSETRTGQQVNQIHGTYMVVVVVVVVMIMMI
jgi:hypothetical protein